ncbi:hypothetical protein PR003_g3239 [Phytophthora rubi]|uniref:BRCT domain-containing protein n=1 Tax=Phytophthora rubi TaxID=129364 RepID=A0A6A3NEQ6_9STRA|nr:hypothetical protein PR002_g3080 [Phytophthora rubi]KAE9049648.1 hypothetical protein PR001_g3103 [Phytophthora rubi]KAE9354658.1 hypothetical protein PR003_g3239 [Phytophthora rubi]
MFAVNGPSGPTSRHERRVKSDRQREEEEETRSRWAEKKREQFFREKPTDKNKTKEIPNESNIFKGCRVVFNGRTGKVSSYYLAKLVQEHGGNVASMLTATRVTHMVGSNLNGSKADKVIKSLGKVKFVSPEWILKSVKQKKRQPEHEYLVYKDKVSHGAGSLQAAFSRTAPPKQ